MDLSIILNDFIEENYEEDLRDQLEIDMITYLKENELREAEFNRAIQLINDSMSQNVVNLDLSVNSSLFNEKFMVLMNELLRLNSEYGNTTQVSENEMEKLIEKSTIIDQENERVNDKFNRIKKIKDFIFDSLKIKIDVKKKNFYKVIFSNGNPSQSEVQFLVQSRKIHNMTVYYVLENSGIDVNKFYEMNHQLMKTNDFLMFLVNVRNFLNLHNEE